MAASVCVLAPNGRRQTVKCSPNTTILQILEDVCKKQGLKPEEYDIKHHNKILDTTATFRFSGLPNNAQLELVNAVKTRADSEVILALSLENGTRPVGNFLPSDTLMDVLKRLCPENIEADKNPVIIYTRREIYGEELAKTTLKSLGLTGGRAMLRLIHRAPEELKTQANISAPLPAKPVEEKPYRRVFKKIDEPMDTSSDSHNRESHQPTHQTPSSTEDSKVDPQIKPTKLSQKPVDLLKVAKEKLKSDQKSMKVSKDDYEAQRAAGKQHEYEEDSMEVDEPVHVPTQDGNHKPSGSVEPTITNIEKEFVFVGDRNAMIFSLESAQSVPSEELPDDFFELTINDARSILRDIKQRQAELEGGGPLMTAAMRNLEESQKQLRQLNRYKKAIIRVLFPNRTILQGVFKPVDTVEDVMKFVQEYLADKNLNFYLYTAPPKCVLDKNSRLIEINCVPGALLHFGTESVDRNVQYLRRDLEDKFTTNSEASLAASLVRQQSRRPESAAVSENPANSVSIDAVPSTSKSVPDTYQNTSANSSGRKKTSSSEKVPKWFKTGK